MFRPAALVLTACILWLPNTHATDLPPEVQQAFEANQQGLNGLQIQGTNKRRVLVPFEEIQPLFSPFIRNADQLEMTALFTITSDGIRFHEQNFFALPDSEEHQPGLRSAFNGQKLFTGYMMGSPDEQYGHLRIRSPKKHDGIDHNNVHIKFLKDIGFRLQETMSGLPEGFRFIMPHSSSDNEIVSSEVVQHKGRELLEVTLSSPEPWASQRTDSVEDMPQSDDLPAEFTEFMIESEKQRRTLVEAKRTIRLLLDPQLNYALVERWNSRDNGDLIQHTKFFNHQQVGDTSLWLPERYEIRHYVWGESPAKVLPNPILIEEVTRTDMVRHESPLPDSEFEFTWDMPGSRIMDYTHPDARDGQSVDTLIPGGREVLALTEGGSRPGPPRTAPSRWPLLLQANGGLLLLALVVFLIWKRRQATSG